MNFNGKRTNTIWLVTAVVAVALFATFPITGAAALAPLQQDATTTPVEEMAAEATGTPEPAEEPTMAATDAPAEEAEAGDTADATMTPIEEAATEMTNTVTSTVTSTVSPAEEGEDAAAAEATATPEPMSDEELISMGEDVYAGYCAACHQLDGQGITNAYPALAGNAFVTVDDPSGLLQLIFTGRAGMPHFRDYLTEQEIAAVVSYVRNGWDNDASPVTLEEVQSVRAEIYSPSEQIDHTGESEKDGSNGSGNSEEDAESQGSGNTQGSENDQENESSRND